MKWTVVSPYFESVDDQWISDAAPSSSHSFRLVPRFGEDRNWHQASSQANASEWTARLRQARSAFVEPDNGVITVFPQLAAAAGIWKRLERSDRPLVAWLFNTEGLRSPAKRKGGRLALCAVDSFVVHSRAEISGYAKLLRMPENYFEFVPLQYGARVETEAPIGQKEPYVFATGSGYRDYATFFAAVEKLNYRTLVLASDRVLEGLSIPSNVTILEQIDRPSIRRLVRHARVNVVPLTSEALTAGLVTIVETFRHGRTVVTTDRSGLEDYCHHGVNSMCAPLDRKSHV